jgi:hypothetical protein
MSLYLTLSQATQGRTLVMMSKNMQDTVEYARGLALFLGTMMKRIAALHNSRSEISHMQR